MQCDASFRLSSVELSPIDLKGYEGGPLLTALRNDQYEEIDGSCVKVYGITHDADRVLLGRGRGYEYYEFLIVCDSFLRGNVRGYGLLQLMYIIRVLADRMHRQTAPENVLFPAGLFEENYELLYKRYWMRPVDRHEASKMPPLLQDIFERSLRTRNAPGLYCLGQRGLHRLFFEVDCLLSTECLRDKDGQSMKLPVWSVLSQQVKMLLHDYDPIIFDRYCA